MNNASFAPAACTQCGATLRVNASEKTATCPYCGTEFIVSDAIQNYYIKEANIKNANVQGNLEIKVARFTKSGTVDSMLERGEILLQQRYFDRAKELFNDILRIEPKNGYGYLGVLLASYGCSGKEDLYDVRYDIRGSNDFKMAVQYLPEQERKWLIDASVEVLNRNTYARACQLFDEGNYKEAESVFSSLGNYQQSQAKAREAYERQMEIKYEKAMQDYKQKKYNDAELEFKELDNYRDSRQMAERIPIIRTNYIRSLNNKNILNSLFIIILPLICWKIIFHYFDSDAMMASKPSPQGWLHTAIMVVSLIAIYVFRSGFSGSINDNKKTITELSGKKAKTPLTLALFVYHLLWWFVIVKGPKVQNCLQGNSRFSAKELKHLLLIFLAVGIVLSLFTLIDVEDNAKKNSNNEGLKENE